MTIYFQHVGEQGGRRDFPKTIGTSTDGLVRFNIDDVPEVTANLSADDRQNLEKMLRKEVPTGFQIWGIPSGAKSILANLRREDWLLHEVRVGSRSEELDLSISGPLLPLKADVRSRRSEGSRHSWRR